MDGTPAYLDPKLVKHYIKAMKNKTEMLDNCKTDLFKCDIFSLGLSFIRAFNCSKIRGINEDPKKQEDCYNMVHELNLPIQMKQIILSMVTFETS